MLKEIGYVLLGIFLICGFIGTFFIGQKIGYEQGYNDGQDIGYQRGYNAGYNKGYNNAIQDVNKEIDKILDKMEVETKNAFATSVPLSNLYVDPIIEWLFKNLKEALHFRVS